MCCVKRLVVEMVVEGWVGCDLEIEYAESVNNWLGRNAIVDVIWLGKKLNVALKQY